MDVDKTRTVRILGWFCMILSIVVMLTSIWLSTGDETMGPALLVVGLALLVIGIVALGVAAKARSGDSEAGPT